jgi:tRNA G26 N,N-dimethylase Trm1
MTYLHCPRCRLAIRCRAHALTQTSCPRCLASARIVSPLFASPLDAHELHAGEELSAIRAANRSGSADAPAEPLGRS